MSGKIISGFIIAVFFVLFSISFLNAADGLKNGEKYSLAAVLLKAKETKNVEEKKRLLKESFNIKPTLYAVKMLIDINKNNPRKCLRIIEFADGIFPLNKYLTVQGAKYAFKSGKTEKAEYFIFKYLKTYPLDKDVLYELAKYYLKTGKTDSAQRVYKTIYKLYEDPKALSSMENITSIFK